MPISTKNSMISRLGQKLSSWSDSLRFKKDRIFQPIVKLTPAWLKPNDITFARIIILALWIPFDIFYPNIYQFAIFLIIFYFDLWDGAVARLRNEVTELGGFLDHFSDKFGTIAILILLYGITDYKFPVLKLFIVWDLFMAILIILEYIFKKRVIAYTRYPFDYLAKIILIAWIVWKILPRIFA